MVNCSLQTYEPKLHLQNQQRQQGVLVPACNPNAGEPGTGGALGLSGQAAKPISELQGQ